MLLQRTLVAAATLFILPACTTLGPQDTNVGLNIPAANRHNEALWAASGDETCYTESTLYMAGGLNVRECVLRNIARASERSMNAHEPLRSDAVGDIRRYSTELGGFYQMRAGRQQDFMDVGAGVTQSTALGAILSADAGANTQLIWLQAAFIPVLISQMNAHEPTRDLYYAGSLGLELIDRRYTVLDQRATAFEDFDKAAPEANCASVSQALGATATMAAADKSVLQGEAQRLMTACLAMRAEAQDMRLAALGARALQAQWGFDYASDIVELDRVLEHKDHQFRFSPAESLGTILASPFRTASTLLSGDSAEAALKTVQTSIAFEGMGVDLEPAHLPERHALAAAITSLSDAALQRSTNANVRSTVAKLRSAAYDIIDVQRANAQRGALLDDLYSAAGSTHLNFDYSVSNGVVTVTLGPPAAAMPAENTRTTEPTKATTN